MYRLMIRRFLALTVGLVLAMPGAAAAQQIPAHLQEKKYLLLMDKATGFYLGSDAAKSVYTTSWDTFRDNGNKLYYQMWQFIRNDDGTYVLRNEQTGFILDSNAAKSVYTHVANGGDFQKWQLTRSDDGSYFFRNKATGFILDSNAAKSVYTHVANGGDFQQWRVQFSAGVPKVGFPCVIRNKVTGLVLASNTAKNVYTHVTNGGTFEQWEVNGIGGGSNPGSYRIRNRSTGAFLDGDRAKGVRMRDANDGFSLPWMLVRDHVNSYDNSYMVWSNEGQCFLDSDAAKNVYLRDLNQPLNQPQSQSKWWWIEETDLVAKPLPRGTKVFENATGASLYVELSVQRGDDLRQTLKKVEFQLPKGARQRKAYGDDANPFLNGIRLTATVDGKMMQKSELVITKGTPLDNELNGHDYAIFRYDGKNITEEMAKRSFDVPAEGGP